MHTADFVRPCRGLGLKFLFMVQPKEFIHNILGLGQARDSKIIGKFLEKICAVV